MKSWAKQNLHPAEDATGATIGILGFVWTGGASGRVVKFSTFRSAASPPIPKFRPVSAFCPDHRRTMNPATLFTSGFTRRRSRLFPGENRAVTSFHGPPPCCKTTVKYAPSSELTIPAVTIYEVTRVYEETRGEWGKRWNWNWKCFLSNHPRYPRVQIRE